MPRLLHQSNLCPIIPEDWEQAFDISKMTLTIFDSPKSFYLAHILISLNPKGLYTGYCKYVVFRLWLHSPIPLSVLLFGKVLMTYSNHNKFTKRAFIRPIMSHLNMEVTMKMVNQPKILA